MVYLMLSETDPNDNDSDNDNLNDGLEKGKDSPELRQEPVGA